MLHVEMLTQLHRLRLSVSSSGQPKATPVDVVLRRVAFLTNLDRLKLCTCKGMYGACMSAKHINICACARVREYFYFVSMLVQVSFFFRTAEFEFDFHFESTAITIASIRYVHMCMV